MKLTTLKSKIQTLAAPKMAKVNPDSWREGKTSTQRGYGYAWQKARAAYLAKYPLCAMCEAEGRVYPASVVDHKVAHRGDMTIFWDSTGWQSLCKPHHDSHAQKRDNESR